MDRKYHFIPTAIKENLPFTAIEIAFFGSSYCLLSADASFGSILFCF